MQRAIAKLLLISTKYSFHGCDITECRAIFATLPASFENDPEGQKEEWRRALRERLMELGAQAAGTLSTTESENPAYAEFGMKLSKVDLRGCCCRCGQLAPTVLQTPAQPKRSRPVRKQCASLKRGLPVEAKVVRAPSHSFTRRNQLLGTTPTVAGALRQLLAPAST